MNFLYVATEKSLIKVFDLGRREVKQVGITRKFEDSQGKSLGAIYMLRGNKLGNILVIISKDKKSYLYDLEIDTISFISESTDKIVWDKADDRFFALQKRSP